MVPVGAKKAETREAAFGGRGEPKRCGRLEGRHRLGYLDTVRKLGQFLYLLGLEEYQPVGTITELVEAPITGLHKQLIAQHIENTGRQCKKVRTPTNYSSGLDILT